MEDQNEIENSESTESVRNPNEIRFLRVGLTSQGPSDRPKRPGANIPEFGLISDKK